MKAVLGRRHRQRSTSVRSDSFTMRGGLMTEPSPQNLPPGSLLGVKNFETSLWGGYRRVSGYERWDGQPKISKQPFHVLRFTQFSDTVVFEADDVVTGGTSGATATVVDVYPSPFPTGESAVGVEGFLLIDATDAFVDTEDLEVSAVVVATMNDSPVESVAPNTTIWKQWKNLAENAYRSSILAVPGSGPITGLNIYSDNVYAFRDNAGGTAGAMYKSTGSGWSEVGLGVRVNFDTGLAAEIEEGDTIDGLTSGASCVVRRMVLKSGDWSTNDAAGYFITDSITSGPFTPGEVLQTSAVPVANADSTTAQVSQTLPLGGTYRFKNHNFGGHISTFRMYGVNGAGQAFEFDDNGAVDVFTLIETGMTGDTPEHVEEFNNYLFMSFSGGSIQNSGFGDPLSWTPVLGADEKNVGDEVTNMHSEKNSAMIVTTRNNTYIIYDENGTFKSRLFSNDTGALEGTLQRLGRVYFIDDRGITPLEATQKFGNFQGSSVSTLIDERLKGRLKSSKIVTSLVSRSRQLVRWVFADGITISMSVAGKTPHEISELQYGIDITCSTSEEIQDGSIRPERIFVGSSDGFVYELDSGSRNFDGDPVESFFRTAYHDSKTPDRIKRYRKCSFDVNAANEATIEVTTDFNFGRIPGPMRKTISLDGQVGFYDISKWGEFVYDGAVYIRPSITMDSSGYNISFTFYHKSDTDGDFSIKGVSISYSFRKINRDTEE